METVVLEVLMSSAMVAVAMGAAKNGWKYSDLISMGVAVESEKKRNGLCN